MPSEKKPIRVDLTKTDAKSFSKYIQDHLHSLNKKTKEELIQFIKDGGKKSELSGSNASDKYIEGILNSIEERNMNVRQILKYLTDIMLYGAGMGVIKIKGSKEELLIESVVKNF